MTTNLIEHLEEVRAEAIEKGEVRFFTLKVDGLRTSHHFTILAPEGHRIGDFDLKPVRAKELDGMSKEGLIEYIKDCQAMIKTDRLKDDGTVEELPLEDCIATVFRNWRKEAELGVRLRNRLIEIGDPQASMS